MRAIPGCDEALLAEYTRRRREDRERTLAFFSQHLG